MFTAPGLLETEVQHYETVLRRVYSNITCSLYSDKQKMFVSLGATNNKNDIFSLGLPITHVLRRLQSPKYTNTYFCTYLEKFRFNLKTIYSARSFQ